MARPKSQRSLPAATAAAARKATEPSAPAASPTGPPLAPRRILLVVIVAVFILFQGILLTVFQTGEDIHWRRELTAIREVHEAGRYQEAARQLTEFGERWPGAKETFDYNRQLGVYHADAGDWETAALFFEKAAEKDPEAPGVNARAGEAHYRAGDLQAAIPFLQHELLRVASPLADHDRANLYLGLILFEQGNVAGALRQTQGIINREPWEEELAPILEAARTEYLEPVEAAMAAAPSATTENAATP